MSKYVVLQVQDVVSHIDDYDEVVLPDSASLYVTSDWVAGTIEISEDFADLPARSLIEDRDGDSWIKTGGATGWWTCVTYPGGYLTSAYPFKELENNLGPLKLISIPGMLEGLNGHG